ncbi:MAG: ParA family protein [Symploca sp. SIO2B6]|nr:ParA family protein [Symploca sp. SIO2E9]NET07832.1 ParA family protein [Symploca sp. SIO2B6]
MKFVTTKVIALTNQKGGCGKTTNAVSLAAAFAREGYSTCLIDVDAQCNATDGLGTDRDEIERAGYHTVADIYMAKKSCLEVELSFNDRFDDLLTLIPSHRGLEVVPAMLEKELLGADSELDSDDLRSQHRMRFSNSIRSLIGERDIVIIDTPPSLGFIMTSALIAASYYIVPIFPSGYELKGLEKLSQTIEKVRSRYNKNLTLLGVILGNFDSTAKLDRDVQNLLLSRFGEDYVFQQVISRSVRHREATVFGETIFERAINSQAANQYMTLAKDIIEKLQIQDELNKQTLGVVNE